MNEKLGPMDCAQFEDVLHDLNRPGTVGFFLREGAFAHAESCRRCALLLTPAKSLDLALRAIASAESGREASSRVETTLMKEFRRTKDASSKLRFRSRIAALGVAAAILLALGFSLYRFSPATKGSVAAPGSGNSAAAGGASNSSVTLDAQNDETEFDDSAAFIPLPYADDPAAVQDDAVVRVVLSPAALASLGLPVAETDGSEAVPADLRVSEDGTPQAIRLVSQEDSDHSF